MDPRTELVDVIRRVRNRWRGRLALRGAVVVAAGTVLALLLSASGLESFRFSAPAIITFRIVTVAVFVNSRSAEASSPYSIEVLPGNTKVPRGADQAVKAKLVGFSSSDVSVMMRAAPNGSFDRVPLIASAQPGAFEGMLFHLEKPT